MLPSRKHISRVALTSLGIAFVWLFVIWLDEHVCRGPERLYYSWAAVRGAQSYRVTVHPITSGGVVIYPTVQTYTNEPTVGVCLSKGRYRFAVLSCNDSWGKQCGETSSKVDIFWPPDLPPPVLRSEPLRAVEKSGS